MLTFRINMINEIFDDILNRLRSNVFNQNIDNKINFNKFKIWI